MNRRYFIFMDESGNTKEEQFFGLGILMIPIEYVGKIYDTIYSFYDRAKDISKLKKAEKIDEFISNKDFEGLRKIIKASVDFELKFKSVNFINKDVYKGIIDKYFSYNNLRFSSLIIDKNNGIDDYNYWDLYIQRASMLIANNIQNDCEYVLICDSITQPKMQKKKFENSMIDCIKYYLDKRNKDKNSILGVLRLESHSSVLLQLVDILLGSVMYFVKDAQGLVSQKSKEKKGFIADSVKKKLNNKNLTTNFTVETPNYFSVWHYKKSK